jgi:hypothetical protein
VKNVAETHFREWAIEAFWQSERAEVATAFILNKTLDLSASLTLLRQIRNFSASWPTSED